MKFTTSFFFQSIQLILHSFHYFISLPEWFHVISFLLIFTFLNLRSISVRSSSKSFTTPQQICPYISFLQNLQLIHTVFHFILLLTNIQHNSSGNLSLPFSINRLNDSFQPQWISTSFSFQKVYTFIFLSSDHRMCFSPLHFFHKTPNNSFNALYFPFISHSMDL